MKKITGLLSIFLILALSLSLFGCAKDDGFTPMKKKHYEQQSTSSLTQDYLSGTWYARVYMDDLWAANSTTGEESFNAELEAYGTNLAALGIEMPKGLILKYGLKFSGDTVIQSIESNETNDYFTFLDEFYNALGDFISDPETFASLYYENGITELEEVAANADMTVEEFLADEIEYVKNTAQRQKEEMNASFMSVSYTLSGDVVKVGSDSDPLEYRHSNGMLITETNGVPLVFSRE